METLKRRNFIRNLMALPVLGSISQAFGNSNSSEFIGISNPSKNLKVSLNAYSFNAALSKGAMNIDDMLLFCSEQGFSAVDITAYYFAGYPNVPEDSVLYHTKRKAFELGLEISGTGVRNDFTWPDKEKRKESVQLVKNWITAAEKLGAPVIRIFGGTQEPKGFRWDQIANWMYDDINECVEFGKSHGVIVGLQNHNDFVKTSDHVIKIMEAINSKWFGLILDTGSYRVGDPYEEIRRNIRYAVNWQVKEKIFIENKEVDINLDKLMTIIRNSNYQGYLPIETLGEGNTKEKIINLSARLRSAMKGN